MSQFSSGISQPRRASGMAIAAMVLGIVSFIPLFCIGPLLAIPALIMGFIALSAIKRAPAQLGGRGMALTGLLLSAGNLVLWVVMIVLFVMAPGFMALMLPPVARAREMANRTADMSNIRQITLAAEMYSTENGGFPPHLAALAPMLPNPRILTSRVSGTAPLAAFPTGTPWSDFASDLDEHCDFVYVGADLGTAAKLDSTRTILLYEKDVYHGQGRNVGFVDGHVQWITTADLAAAFDASNRQRATIGLPPVTLDGPPPTPRRTISAPQGGLPTPTTPTLRSVEPAPPTASSPPALTARAQPPGGFAYAPVNSVTSALDGLKSSNVSTRRQALAFLTRTAADPAQQQAVAAALETCLADPELRNPALTALKTWSTKDNVPALLALLAARQPGDVHNAFETGTILEALGHAGDPATADTLAKYLTGAFHRRAAAKGLCALGAGAQAAVQPLVMHKDWATAREACRILATIGTAESLPALRQGLNHPVAFVHKDAQAAIDAITARGTQ